MDGGFVWCERWRDRKGKGGFGLSGGTEEIDMVLFYEGEREREANRQQGNYGRWLAANWNKGWLLDMHSE